MKKENELIDIFGINSTQFEKPVIPTKSSSQDYEVWTPYLRNEGVLQSDIDVKLLINHAEPYRSFFELPHIYLKNDVATESKLLFVNPVFTDWSNNVFSSLYCWIKGSTDHMVIRHKDTFKISTRYYCLAQILDDDQNPENNGKIKIMRMTRTIGEKIKEKIIEIERESAKKKEELEFYRQKALTDKSIDIDKVKARIKKEYEQILSNDPFRVINGRVFRIKMRKKTADSFTQYDTSEFRDERVSVIIDGENCNDKEKIIQFLKENSPDLTKYRWEGYTEEEKKFICRCIIDYFPQESDVVIKMKRNFPDIMDYASEFYNGKLTGTDITPEQKPKKEEVKPIEEETEDYEDFDNIDDIDFDLED